MTPDPTSRVILIVDDEPEMLRLVESTLSGLGYELIIARGAADALRHFERLNRPPDLILTDVVMPGMSGPMLVDRLLESTPDLRVLFMSGYDDRQVVRRYVLGRGFPLISKPFTPATLRLAVTDAFAGRAVAAGNEV